MDTSGEGEQTLSSEESQNTNPAVNASPRSVKVFTKPWNRVERASSLEFLFIFQIIRSPAPMRLAGERADADSAEYFHFVILHCLPRLELCCTPCAEADVLINEASLAAR